MYIKLSFHEKFVIVPGTWGGVVINLTAQPKIFVSLPANIKPNHRANKKPNGCPNNKNLVPCDYDYYLDCDKASLSVVQEALDFFNARFKNRSPRTIMHESNQINNPIVAKLKSDLFRAANPAAAISTLFSNNTDEKNKDGTIDSFITKLML